MSFSRRNFLNLAAGAGTLAVARAAQQPQAERPAVNMEPWAGQSQPYPYYTGRSTVSLVKGENRRKNITDALVAIDDQIQPVLKTKKYVILKPNCVSTIPLGTTNAEALMGILDYLAPRYKGPVIIAESSGNTLVNYEALGYQKIVDQHRSQNVSLLDLNAEGKYEVITVFDYHAHVIPVRLAARLLDPDAYIICSRGHEDAQRPGGDAVGEEHGPRRAAVGASQGDASLERQAQVPRRHAHDAGEHDADGAEDEAVLGRRGHRRLRGHGRQRPARRNARASPDCDRLDRLHRRRPRGRGSHGDRSELGRQPASTATRSDWGSTTWRRSTFAARSSRTSGAPTACTPTSTSRSSGWGPWKNCPPGWADASAASSARTAEPHAVQSRNL